MSKSLRFGAHIPILPTLLKTAKSTPDITFQIFLGNKLSYNVRDVSLEDKKRTLSYLTEHNKSFYVHTPYVANLSKDESSQSFDCVAKELVAIEGLPAAAVLHIGKLGTLQNVANNVNSLISESYLIRSRFEQVPFTLLMETAAGQGTELGKNWNEIRRLFELFDKRYVGLCVDTAHCFAAKMNKFETHEDIIQLFDDCEESGARLSMIHLNDSSKPYGSSVDRHAPLRTGYIWKENDSGLCSLLDFCTVNSIDVICETKDIENDRMILQKFYSMC